jgi:hypothetical protein
MKTRYNILAFIFIGVLGALSHFVYEFSGNNKLIGYFFATNESTWEHLKLLFFPTIIYSAIEYLFVRREIKNYIPAVVISVIIGMLSIVVLFYTYRGVIGKNIDFINILIYYLGLIISLTVKNKIVDSEILNSKSASLLFLIISLIIALFFFRFTYSPPTLAIFKPPVSSI